MGDDFRRLLEYGDAPLPKARFNPLISPRNNAFSRRKDSFSAPSARFSATSAKTSFTNADGLKNPMSEGTSTRNLLEPGIDASKCWTPPDRPWFPQKCWAANQLQLLHGQPSLKIADQSIGHVLNASARDSTPALYFVGLYFWRRLAPDTDAAVRMCSTLWSLAGLLAMCALARAVAGCPSGCYKRVHTAMCALGSLPPTGFVP
ncbi:MAG: hypothetical protein NTY46_04830 [Candidatus Sumerlaeota bacterium]|nr:hypothetical protein [Candidatus Sumerlaeota bacterium]